MQKFLHIVGTRPNFMKAAPVLAALSARGIPQLLLHTGQHYDANMSDVFFEQLGMPPPDINLEVGSGSHAQQTAEVMIRLEKVLIEQRPDWILVYGDVNSTMAASLVASKMGIRIAHVEAGLRSRDREMPEEINRLVTDQLADLLFTPSKDGDENLAREGIPREKIRLVGNVMIDTLVRLLPKADTKWPQLKSRFVLTDYVLVTLHRPSNVDDENTLKEIVSALETIAKSMVVMFPVHPRTKGKLVGMGFETSDRFRLIEPQGYLEFLALQRHANVLVTDSGGIQEETTYLGIPCLTLRENTERPITVSEGTNILIGRDMPRLLTEFHSIVGGHAKKGRIPELWDGKAGERIADVLAKT
jgi:UDP-N-acetylglucosamine 2-epimerase (non-hydrolysing)